MKPFRKSAGYTSSGKKKYDRYFFVEEKNNNNKNELNKQEVLIYNESTL